METSLSLVKNLVKLGSNSIVIKLKVQQVREIHRSNNIRSSSRIFYFSIKK